MESLIPLESRLRHGRLYKRNSKNVSRHQIADFRGGIDTKQVISQDIKLLSAVYIEGLRFIELPLDFQ